MRVLLVTSRADHGGGPKHVLDLASYLIADTAIQPFIALPRDAPYWDIALELLGSERLLEIPHRKVTLRSLIKVARFVRTHQIETVHTHGKGAGLLGRLATLGLRNIRSVHTFHGVHTDEYNRGGLWVYRSIERLLTTRTSKIICVSNGERSLIKQLGLPEAKLSVVLNGVRIPDAPCSLPSFRLPLQILVIARHTYQKNTLAVLDIAAALDRRDSLPYLIRLVGAGDLLDDFVRSCSERQLNATVEVTGHSDDVLEHLLWSHMVLSTSRWEGLPLALLEATAASRPVIATDVVGNREAVIPNVTGMLFAEGDFERAAELIETLGHDRQELERLSCTDPALLDQISVSRMGRETVDVYRSQEISGEPRNSTC